jgi:hypothetical protein
VARRRPVYVQAAALLKPEEGRDVRLARTQAEYQERALRLLRTALTLVPAAERPGYWRDRVMKDAALAPLRRLPEFGKLGERFAGQDR